MMNNKKKPFIGISSNVYSVENGNFAGQERIYINRDYISSIQQAEGIPFLLPIVLDHEVIYRQVESMDGLIISGGYDVHPFYYKEEPCNLLQAICPERDEYEMALLTIAYALKKPILGICRGLQLINVFFGGTLYQDLSQHKPTSQLQHSQVAKADVASHSIDIQPNTKLYKIFGKNKMTINSFHHQAIKDLASDLIVNAMAKDGIIEGIETVGPHFVLGVQWHPEMMTATHSEMLKLFQAFVLECSSQS